MLDYYMLTSMIPVLPQYFLFLPDPFLMCEKVFFLYKFIN